MACEGSSPGPSQFSSSGLGTGRPNLSAHKIPVKITQKISHSQTGREAGHDIKKAAKIFSYHTNQSIITVLLGWNYMKMEMKGKICFHVLNKI
jgi:hypothetical protein